MMSHLCKLFVLFCFFVCIQCQHGTDPPSSASASSDASSGYGSSQETEYDEDITSVTEAEASTEYPGTRTPDATGSGLGSGSGVAVALGTGSALSLLPTGSAVSFIAAGSTLLSGLGVSGSTANSGSAFVTLSSPPKQGSALPVLPGSGVDVASSDGSSTIGSATAPSITMPSVHSSGRGSGTSSPLSVSMPTTSTSVGSVGLPSVSMPDSGISSAEGSTPSSPLSSLTMPSTVGSAVSFSSSSLSGPGSSAPQPSITLPTVPHHSASSPSSSGGNLTSPTGYPGSGTVVPSITLPDASGSGSGTATVQPSISVSNSGSGVPTVPPSISVSGSISESSLEGSSDLPSVTMSMPTFTDIPEGSGALPSVDLSSIVTDEYEDSETESDESPTTEFFTTTVDDSTEIASIPSSSSVPGSSTVLSSEQTESFSTLGSTADASTTGIQSDGTTSLISGTESLISVGQSTTQTSDPESVTSVESGTSPIVTEPTTILGTSTSPSTVATTTTLAPGCEAVDCGENRHCVMNGPTATCDCNSGYTPGDTTNECIPSCDGCQIGICVSPGVCECEESFQYYDESSLDCEVDLCVVNGDAACSYHGACTPSSGTYSCECDSGYSGDYCELPICTGDCSDHGSCTEPETCECECDASGSCWTGSDCSVADCIDVDDCSGNGSCVAPNTCQCDTAHAGEDCSLLSCPDDCSGHGTVLFSSAGVFGCDGSSGECTCTSGYTGTNCSEIDELVVHTCPLDCSGVSGACLKPEYVCDCPESRYGVGCEYIHCPGSNEDCLLSGECDQYCNGNGVCNTDTGYCDCVDGAYGSACQSFLCSTSDDGSVCHSRGSCDPSLGTCVCLDGYFGDSCEYVGCPVNSEGWECSYHGSCDYDEGLCTCDEGYWGSACEYLECPRGGADSTMCSGNGSPYVRTKGIRGCNGATGQCTCRIGWSTASNGVLLYVGFSGDACEQPLCPSLYSTQQCSGNGDCLSGSCVCEEQNGVALFTGDACQYENAEVVPAGERVAMVRSGMTVGGISESDLTAELCQAMVDGIASALSVDPAIVSLSQCAGISARRRLQQSSSGSLSLDIRLRFVTDATSTSGLSSASALSASVVTNKQSLSSSISQQVEAQTGTVVAVDADSVTTSIPCPGDCSGNGVCDSATGVCACDEGYSVEADASCKLPSCFDDSNLIPLEDGASMFEGCNYNGECTTPNSCACYSGYSGDQCESVSCLQGDSGADCDGNGRCLQPDECTCDDTNTSLGCLDDVLYCAEITNLCETSAHVREACLYTCSVLVLEDGGDLSSYPDLEAACIDVDLSPTALYSGDTCEVVGCSGCSGHGTCDEPWECTCEDGYQGEKCTEIECDVVSGGVSCGGHGDCVAPNECECDDGWSGVACDVPDCDGCASVFPSASARFTCEEPYTGNASVCVCQDGWEGSQCDTPRCDLDLCESCETPDVCASCVDDTMTGDLCQYTKECPSSEAGPCNGNGGCLSPNECTCFETALGSYLGDECDVVECDDVDECNGNGACLEPNYCTCAEDDFGRALWTGDTCDTWACLEDDDGAICSSHGTCSGPLECMCYFGYTGNSCESDVCASIDCEETAVCVRTAAETATCMSECVCDHGACLAGSTTCQCDEGYYGAACADDAPIAYLSGSLQLATTAAAFTVGVQLQVQSGIGSHFGVGPESVVIESFADVDTRRSNSGSQLLVSYAVYAGIELTLIDSFNDLSLAQLSALIGISVLDASEIEVVDPYLTGSASTESFNTMEETDDSSQDASLVIGLAAGCGSAVLLLVVLALFFRRRRKHSVARVAAADTTFMGHQVYPER
eukprot:Rmarinus@m.8744